MMIGDDMSINYILDNELKYIEPVEKGLRKHNNSFTSGITSGSLKLYLVSDHEIKACIECSHFWDWVEVEKIYYEDYDALKILFNEVYKKYNGKLNAIYYKTHDNKRLNDLKKVGFKTVGKIADKPLNFTTEELVDYEMTVDEMSHHYEIVLGPKENDPYQDKFNQLINEYNKSINYSDDFEEVFYVAFDDDKVIGGVYGELSNNYLYVSVIWVDEAYRGHNIATTLLDKIESYSIDKGYKRSFLETGSFQAKEFYEKKGYEVISTLYNFPKGHDMYTMVKSIKF